MVKNSAKERKGKKLSNTILRWTLGLLLCVFVGLGLYQYYLQGEGALSDYLHQSDQLFGSVKKTLNLVFEENLSKLDAVGRSSEVQTYLRDPAGATNVAVISNLLDSVLKSTPYAEGVTIEWLGDPVTVKTLDGKKATIGSGTVLVNSNAELVGRDFSDREYTKKIKDGKEVWLSSPTISRATGKPNVVLARAISVGGQVKAFLIMSFALEYLTKSFVDDASIGTGYMSVIHESGAIIAHPDKSLILNSEPGPSAKQLVTNVLSKGEGDFISNGNGASNMYRVQKWQFHDSTVWYLTFSRPLDEVYASVSTNLRTLLVVFVGSFILVWLIITFLLRSAVTRPVERFSHRLSDISQGRGDLTQTIPVESRDEVGRMAQTFNHFLEGLRTLLHELKQDMGQVSAVASRLKDNAGSLSSAVVELASTTKSVAAHAETQKKQTQVASANLAEVTQESATVTLMVEKMDESLSQSSSAIEEMAANIRSVADQAQTNDQAADLLARTMDQGMITVKNLQGIVRSNAEASQNIQEMIQVIMQISVQTNLLAMNAAIEAAHAGDAGRGFAVVADEIRKLADQSATSAKEIQTTVKRVASGFDAILGSTNATGSEFESLRVEVERVRQGSREIALAMKEQKTANDSVLETTAQLIRLSSEAKASIQAQFQSTKGVSAGVQTIADLSLEVAQATAEESTALDITAKLGDEVLQLAQELNMVTEKVQAAFRSFRTSEDGAKE